MSISGESRTRDSASKPKAPEPAKASARAPGSRLAGGKLAVLDVEQLWRAWPRSGGFRYRALSARPLFFPATIRIRP
jgi:hypothetical protein